MLKKILAGALVALWVIGPMVSTAQEMAPGKWWRLPRVGKHLELSQEEENRLDELFLNSRRRLIDLKSAVEREQFELDNLLEKEALDEKAVMAQFSKLEKARSDLANERFRYLLEARKTLGFDRYQQLKVLFGEFKKRGHGGGRHGFDDDAVPPH
jgi:Spy/CpxP family protein refolding chaperone